METLVLSDSRLQFRYGHAEQDFLDWCVPDQAVCWVAQLQSMIRMRTAHILEIILV